MNKNKGFTLIELLIVMAILGVLAVVVLVAINPVQQLARTRDAGRKSAVTQMGHALSAYYTVHAGSFITSTTCADLDTWITCLSDAGELSTPPSAISYATSATGTTECTGTPAAGEEGGVQNGFCYKWSSSSSAIVVYATLESDSEKSKCTAGGDPYFAYSSYDGRGGLICSGSEPVPGDNSADWVD